MFKNFTLFTCLFASLSLTAQNITIPDAEFKKVLVDNVNINTNRDGEISKSEAIAYTGGLRVGNKKISNLSGIENFTSITNLWCSNNKIKSLDLSGNTKLTRLVCINNELGSLILTKNVDLDSLNCSNNQLKSLDLSQNINLKELDCADNELTVLDLTRNLGLGSLNCINNDIKSLDLNNNINLKKIFFKDNELTTLDLTKNIDLVFLNCTNNKLKSIDLNNNINLKYLYFNDNELTTLDLNKNVDLVFLNCANNNLNSLDLSNNTKIKVLGYHQNRLPFSEIKKLKDKFNSFLYVSDKTLFSTLNKKVGETVDYSKEKEFNGVATNFQWYNSSDIEVDASFVKETSSGSCIFEFLQLGSYYCKMKNTDLSRGSLKTKTITVIVGGKIAQQISFIQAPIIAKIGDVITLNAVSSSKLPVKYSVVSGSAELDGNKLTCVGVGSLRIKAIQMGNSRFNYGEKTIEITVDFSTGVEDVTNLIMKVYPNPVTTYLNIEFVDRKERHIKVFDIKGRLLKSKNSSSSSDGLNFSDYRRGVYFMRVETDTGNSTHRIIKN